MLVLALEDGAVPHIEADGALKMLEQARLGLVVGAVRHCPEARLELVPWAFGIKAGNQLDLMLSDCLLLLLLLFNKRKLLYGPAAKAIA